jgi:Fe-S-cluster containining protein
MVTSFVMIYAAVPRINCKGKCQASCGPISAAPDEVEHFEKATGKPFPDAEAMLKGALKAGSSLDCPYLNPVGHCEVYADRPLICRLWGVAEGMPCKWGCKPERPMSDAEAGRLLDATAEVAW